MEKPEDQFRNKYIGTIESYFETGMENFGVIIHDDRGITKGRAFNNETKLWDGPEMDFKDLGWAIFLNNKKCFIKVFENGVVIYSGPLTNSKSKLAKANYAVSFLPEEVEQHIFLDWVKRELKVELYTNERAIKDI